MFALPGIVALVAFLLVRPLDLFPELSRLPLLYGFAGAALLGLVLDIRLGFTKVRGGTALPWVIAFVGWCAVTTLIHAPATLSTAVTGLAILLCLYLLLAHGVASLKATQLVVGVLIACSLWVAAACVHQGMQEKQCVAFLPGETRVANMGHPDGRTCGSAEECGDGDENAYACEHVGWFGITSIGDGRVRYIGTLQDPNEVALFTGATLPLVYALYRRKRTRFRALIGLVATVLTIVAVQMTQSRGGQIVLVSVFVAEAVRRYGLAQTVRFALPVGAAVAVPLYLLLGGEERADAESSTMKRLGCMIAGFEMFFDSPLTGVGYRQFMQHHDQTAHNAFILALGELGTVGFLVWTIIYYLAIKSFVVTAIRCRSAESEAARVWATALCSTLIALSVGVFFLSFTYHYALWILLGLGGAVYSAVARHDGAFRVRFGWRDLVVVAAGNVLLLSATYAYATSNI